MKFEIIKAHCILPIEQKNSQTTTNILNIFITAGVTYVSINVKLSSTCKGRRGSGLVILNRTRYFQHTRATSISHIHICFKRFVTQGFFFSMIQSFSQIRSRQTLQISWYKTDTQIISTCFIITLIDFFFFLIFIKCLKLLISCCWFFQDLFGCCKCKTYSYEIHIYSYYICNYKCTRFQ